MNVIKKEHIEFFEQEIFSHYQYVCRLIYLLCSDEALAEDVTQDTMEICWNHVEKIKEYGDVKSGVIKIAINRFYRVKKSKGNHTILFDNEELLNYVSSKVNIEEAIIKMENKEGLRKALEYLSIGRLLS